MLCDSFTPRTSREKTKPPSEPRLQLQPCSVSSERAFKRSTTMAAKRSASSSSFDELRIEQSRNGGLFHHGASVAHDAARPAHARRIAPARRSSADRAPIALAAIRFENGSLEAAIDQEVFEGALVLEIIFRASALDLIERRLRDIEWPFSKSCGIWR